MLGFLRPTLPTLGRSHLTLPDGKPRYPPQRRSPGGRLAPRGPSYFELEHSRRAKVFMQCPELSKSLARRLVNAHCRTWEDALRKAADPKCKKVVFGRKAREALEDRALVKELMEVQDACVRGCEVDKFCECIHVHFCGEF